MAVVQTVLVVLVVVVQEQHLETMALEQMQL
jgi:hypothetical protein